MFDKPLLLLIVIAIFVAAVWFSAAPYSGRITNSDWKKPRPDARRHFARVDATGDVIRRLHHESGF